MAVYGSAVISIFGHPQGFDRTLNNLIIRGTIGFTGAAGALYPGAGFPLNWLIEQIKSQYTGIQKDSVRGNVLQLPTEVDVWSAVPSGFQYCVDRATGNLHLLVASNGASGASGPLVEYGGVLTTQMLNDVLQFCAIFPLNV